MAVSDTRRRKRSASSSASVKEVSGSTTRNSSPPYRDEISVFLTCASKILANSTKTASPVMWP